MDIHFLDCEWDQFFRQWSNRPKGEAGDVRHKVPLRVTQGLVSDLLPGHHRNPTGLFLLIAVLTLSDAVFWWMQHLSVNCKKQNVCLGKNPVSGWGSSQSLADSQPLWKHWQLWWKMLLKHALNFCFYQDTRCQMQSPRAGKTPELLTESSDQVGLDSEWQKEETRSNSDP